MDEEEQIKHQINVLKKKRRKLYNSFQNANNLKMWTENQNHRDYCDIIPGNNYWFKSVFYEYENKDKRIVAQNMKTLIKPDIDP